MFVELSQEELADVNGGSLGDVLKGLASIGGMAMGALEVAAGVKTKNSQKIGNGVATFGTGAVGLWNAIF